MSERYGSRFADGGYQAPSTNAAALERGRAVRHDTFRIGTKLVELSLIPLLHGRPELYEIEYKWDDKLGPQPGTMYNPCIVRGESFARKAYALTAAELELGRLPDNVVVAPGTPLGP